MQVVLMAAGLGSRLGALTERLPKALISVAGRPLLSHAIRFARRLEPSRIVVVGGFCFAEVRAALATIDADVTLVENPNFRDGNLLSLMAARPHVSDDFLLMNVDHIYRPEVAERIRPAVREITAFVDFDRSLGADDMKVLRDDAGRVRSIAKTLTEFDAGYVGMTRVPQAELDRYWATAEQVVATEGRAVHVERILARLATTAKPPECRDISGIGWLEVDMADERDAADVTIRNDPDAWA